MAYINVVAVLVAIGLLLLPGQVRSYGISAPSIALLREMERQSKDSSTASSNQAPSPVPSGAGTLLPYTTPGPLVSLPSPVSGSPPPSEGAGVELHVQVACEEKVVDEGLLPATAKCILLKAFMDVTRYRIVMLCSPWILGSFARQFWQWRSSRRRARRSRGVRKQERELILAPPPLAEEEDVEGD